MANKRRAGFLILFNLLKGKKPYGIAGLALIVFSILLLLFMTPFLIGFSGENGNYNFSDIQKYGIKKDAKITYIKTVHNVSINDVHPLIISYEYEDNGNKVTDKSETLDSEKIAGFNIGTVIQILVFDHQSIIKDVEPYYVPAWPILIPAAFFIVGAILLLIGLIPALKIYNLYKTGIMKDAVITSIGFDTTPALLHTKIPVNYFYQDEHQNKIYGEGESTDAMFWMQKKVGDSIKIFVSKNDERKTMVVPISEAVRYNWFV